jgi:hypothetical protein
MTHALRLNVDVGVDHLVKLPNEVPVGPAEIIVILEESTGAHPLDDFEPVQPVRGIRLSELVIEDRH